jgi:hypothetical protein
MEVKPMKKKLIKALLASGIILLFLSVSFGQGSQSITQVTTTQPTPLIISCNLVNDDCVLSTTQLELTDEDQASLQQSLSQLIIALEAGSTIQDLKEIITTSSLNKRFRPLLSFIIDTISQLSMFKNRVFIISQGWGYTFNPNKSNDVDFHKALCSWFYTPRSSLNMTSKTLLIRHSRIELQSDMFNGRQLGIMNRFRGIHITIPREFPEKTYNFFLGTAKHIGCMGFPSFF